MYNKEKLLEKTKGIFPLVEYNILKGLVADIDAINSTHQNKYGNLYIDFIIQESKELPCGFLLKLKPMNETIVMHPIAMSGLTLEELNDSVVTLTEYCRETRDLEENSSEDIIDTTERFYKEILEDFKNSRITYFDGKDVIRAEMETFTKKPIQTQLDDLDRLPSIILNSLSNLNASSVIPYWINEVALINLVKYYHEKCEELESRLKLTEDKMLTNSIIKK